MKQGEVDYLQNIGAAAALGAYNKPFSHFTCSKNLVDVGLILSLLPQPPARLLDLGCGAGWTSVFFALRGYEVVGQDIAPDMIDYARQNKDRYQAQHLEFIVSDYESLSFTQPFDCAVFYDSLHHAVDERAALQSVYRALRPGGVLVTHEPGAGHSQSDDAKHAMQQYGVTERDMPPALIRRLCQEIGFSRFELLTDPTLTILVHYGINLAQLTRDRSPWWRRSSSAARLLADRDLQRGGICLVTK